MIIMAFDSTAKVASVAICDDERPLAVYNIDNGLTQSELLLPMAENMLKSIKLGFSDVELFACATGPGSFTGVRIGAALVKGLAFGKDIPCVSVSTLDGLAENAAGLSGIIVPVMDARRSQVYTALYSSDGESTNKLCEDSAISTSELAQMLRAHEGSPIYLVGDGYSVAKAALDAEGVKTENTPTLLINENAYSLAKVALRKYRSGEFTTDKQISPTYLRMPQAERERLEKQKAEKKD